MIGRYIVLSAAFALAGPSAEIRGQAIRGPTEHTTCSTPFHPAAGLTFHGGYAWAVIFHTFPYQFGFATYRALPDPATSVDGQATWSNPGAYVECTNTWFYNHNGSVAYVEYRWHIIRYLGEIRANSGGCAGDEGGMTDSPYLTSYDPYAPHQGEDALQGCGDGGDDAGSGEETQTCWWEWVELEISYDGGKTWEPYWSGWGQVCEEQAA